LWKELLFAGLNVVKMLSLLFNCKTCEDAIVSGTLVAIGNDEFGMLLVVLMAFGR
jgi:hypothetical protein